MPSIHSSYKLLLKEETIHIGNPTSKTPKSKMHLWSPHTHCQYEANAFCKQMLLLLPEGSHYDNYKCSQPIVHFNIITTYVYIYLKNASFSNFPFLFFVISLLKINIWQCIFQSTVIFEKNFHKTAVPTVMSAIISDRS